jgi:SAM-dependent methyltransferase
MSRERLAEDYDREMAEPLNSLYYGFSSYYNLGYWYPDTKSQGEASENLVEKLLAFIPEKGGKILDVACGMGATTRHLTRYYRPEDVTGINISETQLERAREIAPTCRFLLMDATRLDFPDESFDDVICVEAAFHFESRDDFIREAFRVLKPGGHLVHSDVLYSEDMPASLAERAHLPRVNQLPTPEALKERLAAAGFQETEIIDATPECWESFDRHSKEFAESFRNAMGWKLEPGQEGEPASMFSDAGPYIRYYLLASSRKPAAQVS